MLLLTPFLKINKISIIIFYQNMIILRERERERERERIYLKNGFIQFSFIVNLYSCHIQ